MTRTGSRTRQHGRAGRAGFALAALAGLVLIWVQATGGWAAARPNACEA